MENKSDFNDKESMTYVTNIQLKINLNDINERFQT